MRIRKLRGRRRKVGDVVVEQSDLEDLRETFRDIVEGNIDGDSIQNGDVKAWPGEDNIYVFIEIGGEELQIPDKSFCWKALQIL